MSNIVPNGKDLSSLKIAKTIKIKTIDDLQRLGENSGCFEECKQAAQIWAKNLCGKEIEFPKFSSMARTDEYLGLTYVCNHCSDTPVTLAIPANHIRSNNNLSISSLVSCPITFFVGFWTNCLSSAFRLKVLPTIVDSTILHYISWLASRANR